MIGSTTISSVGWQSAPPAPLNSSDGDGEKTEEEGGIGLFIAGRETGRWALELRGFQSIDWYGSFAASSSSSSLVSIPSGRRAGTHFHVQLGRP